MNVSTTSTKSRARTRTTTFKGVTSVEEIPTQVETPKANEDVVITEAITVAPATTPAQATNDGNSEAGEAIVDASTANAGAKVAKPAVKVKGRVATTTFKGFGNLINIYAAECSEKTVIVEALKNAGCKNPEAKLGEHKKYLKNAGVPFIRDDTHLHYVINARSGKQIF